MRREAPADHYLPLSAAAQLVRLPPSRVRRYVRAGLVRPRGAAGRELLFGEPELARLRRIRRLIEELGLNVAGVEVVLRLLDDLELLRSTVEQRTVPNSARSGAS